MHLSVLPLAAATALTIAVPNYNERYDLDAAVVPVARICEARLRAQVAGDPNFLGRFMEEQKLTLPQKRRLFESCLFFDLGAKTVLDMLEESRTRRFT